MDALKDELDSFRGTTRYYEHFTGLRYTDGVRHLADRADAYWLVDAIMSWQLECKVRRVPFQFWRLRVNEDKTAVLEMVEDTGLPVIARQTFRWTDFPVGEIKLYFQNGVLFLPSEY